MNRSAISLVGLLAFACTRELPPPTRDRDGIGTPIGAACVTLRALQCPEGAPSSVTGRTCYEAITVAAQLAPFPADCVAVAGSVDAVRACGTPNTMRVRCTP